MSSAPSGYRAHRCSFHPDRRDVYLRLGAVTVFVRDQERSLRFYVDQLGFRLAFDTRQQPEGGCLAVTPPDGTAILNLIAAQAGSAEYELIGRPTQTVFLTEDIFAKCEEWRQRGVRFQRLPEVQSSGAISATFEDVDGNSFTLLSNEDVTREVEAQRQSHLARLESERRARDELETAKRAQARLFPQTFPIIRSLDFAGACRQARHVGGDYYDFLDLGRQRFGLVVGDVSGKGTAAALLMANLQAHVHSLCAAYWSRPFVPIALEQPERLLSAVNRLFYENTGDNAYATLFFAEYDDIARQLRYANCGHLAALLLRKDNSVERLEATCAVVGLTRNWSCAAGERRLSPGDVLVLYTDGVTESFNEAGEEFGEERLLETLRRHRELAPEALLGTLADEVHHFSPREQHDDLTLVIARCRG